MRYYIEIDGEEYFFSQIVFIGMEDDVKKYIVKKDNINYVDTQKIINDKNFELLKVMYFRCNSFAGMYLMEIEKNEEFNSLGYKFRDIDYLSEYLLKKGEIEKACNLLLDGIKLSLKNYNEVINENSNNKAKC